MKPTGACLLVCLLWAGVYLPGLGSVPLKHEEPRRALPAVRMLQTGDWLVPRIGAGPYLRKPPLLNWLIAVCFRASGGPSELAARLPSVVATLALALTVATAGRRWLGASGALLAAVFTLTNFAVMETGRLAELEALYLSLTGIALMLWLTAWQARANAWRLWCAPAPFLALGMLAKGPAHLIFFYGVAGAVLLCSGEWRTLLNAAHAVALVIVVAPFLGWAIPCAAAVGGSGNLLDPGGAWAFWWREISSRATLTPTGHVSLREWLLRLPQGFANFLPWTVLLPLLWSARTLGHFAQAPPRERALFQGMRGGMVATFLVMSLLPGSSARYVYPLVVVPGVLLAWVLCLPERADGTRLYPPWLPGVWRSVNVVLCGVIVCSALAMPWLATPASRTGMVVLESCVIIAAAVATCCWRDGGDGRVLSAALRSAAGMVLITSIYSIAAVPRLNQPRTGLPRELATSIRTSMPAGKTLGVLDDGYHAFWYYLEPSVVYFRHPEEGLSMEGIEYFLLPSGSLEVVTEEAARRGILLLPVTRTYDVEHNSFVLVKRSSAASASFFVTGDVVPSKGASSQVREAHCSTVRNRRLCRWS